MTAEVAIARLQLRVRGVPAPIAAADAFVEAVLAALERLLDALPDLPEAVVLPRLSIHLRVAVLAGESPADAIARALADAIAQAAFCARVPASPREAVDRLPVPARVPASRARLLHAAAQAARAGQPAATIAAMLGWPTAPLEGRDRRPELDAAAPSTALVPGEAWGREPRWAAIRRISPEGAHTSPGELIAAALRAPRPLALLGRLARARLLGCLAEALVLARGGGAAGGADAAGSADAAGLAEGAGRPAEGAARPSPGGSRAQGAAAALSLLGRVVEELADCGDDALAGPPSLCEAAMARIESARARALRAITWAGEALAAPVQLVLALAELSRTGRGALARSRAWRAAVLAAIARHGLDEIDLADPAAIDAAGDPGALPEAPDAEGAARGAAGRLAPADPRQQAPPGRSAAPAEAALGGSPPAAPGVDEDRVDARRDRDAGGAVTTEPPPARGARRAAVSRVDRTRSGRRVAPHPPPERSVEPPVPRVEPRALAVAADDPRRSTMLMAARPLAELGRLARRRCLSELVGQLDEPAARALLACIHAELLEAGPRLAAQPQAAGALRAAEARALRDLTAAGGVDASDAPALGALLTSDAGPPGPPIDPAHLPPAVKLVLAFAELCRTTPAALLGAPSLRGHALATIERLVGAAASTPAQAASTPSQAASTPAQPAPTPAQPASTPSQPAPTPAQPAPTPAQPASGPPPVPPAGATPRPARPSAAPAPVSAATDPLVPSPLAARPDVSLALPDLPPEETAIFSRAAGLAFLVRPLIDLGWAHAVEAIQPEPSLALHAVLRRLLAAELGEEWADDPAAWMLAGLLDAPAPEEREADAAAWTPDRCAALARAALEGAAPRDAAWTHDAACAAWARAAVAQARLLLAGFPAGAEDLAQDVIAVPGVLRRAEAALEVRLPFTRSYEALLRAGLSLDIAQVPWLDEGPLRFVFGEQE
ncbi:hypothetical protein [Sorangium sp. So ce861]|uniref:hypothetical protein n=1 Tax=Sorangium sp. So ce861 TaxID=3133323 RepID=UPI003F624AE9